jgi:hypothetical protein
MTVSQLIGALQALPNQQANVQVQSTLAAGVANIGTVTQTTPATGTFPPHSDAKYGTNGPAHGAGVVLLAQ